MRVAAIQTTAGDDRDANLDRAASLVDEAVARGAELVVLPELFSVAGGPAQLRAGAEPLDGPTATWASGLARGHGIHLVAGTFPERPAGPGDGRLANTCCTFDPEGTLVGVYRKVHLFDVDVAGGRLRESETFRPGDARCTVGLATAAAGVPGPPPVLGLAVCYDLRFPELSRALALDGTTVLAVPSAFTAATGPAHWELLVRARAVENGLFVVAAGQVGDPPPGMPACHGHSMVVDPWGTVLAERHHPSPGVVVAELDAGVQRRVRRDLPLLAHRRPSAYRGTGDDTGREEGHRA